MAHSFEHAKPGPRDGVCRRPPSPRRDQSVGRAVQDYGRDREVAQRLSPVRLNVDRVELAGRALAVDPADPGPVGQGVVYRLCG